MLARSLLIPMFLVVLISGCDTGTTTPPPAAGGGTVAPQPAPGPAPANAPAPGQTEKTAAKTL